jgi:GTPase Era involved in 16S rRNA processing
MCLRQAIRAARDVIDSLAPGSILCEAVNFFEQNGDSACLQVLLLGMFNRGKSTILNALLQAQVVPTGLVPLTGASIRVTYGPESSTRVLFKDGTEKLYPGTDVLEEVAVLSGGIMRADIDQAVVEFPHPLLKAGMDLIDLPGVNDRPEQEDFVRRRLFTADLIIHVLSASDQWTLDERELLNDWVLAQGLRNIVFVVNRANLLDEDERDEAFFAIRDGITTEFDLPSRPLELVYRLDALPALRAALRKEAVERSAKLFLRDLKHWVIRNQPNLRDLRQRKLERLGALLHDEIREQVLKPENTPKESQLRPLADLCQALPYELRSRCHQRSCAELLKQHLQPSRGSKSPRPYDPNRSPW